MAIDNAIGDMILFLDDDAVAEEKWTEKYEKLFISLPNAGGISGVTYRAYVRNGELIKTNEYFYEYAPTKNVLHRKPLPEYFSYYG